MTIAMMRATEIIMIIVAVVFTILITIGVADVSDRRYAVMHLDEKQRENKQ